MLRFVIVPVMLTLAVPEAVQPRVGVTVSFTHLEGIDASGINNAGTIVGQAPGGDLEAVLRTTKGALLSLSGPHGDALSVAESGLVAVTFNIPDGQHCGRWSAKRGLEDLTPGADLQCLAMGINSRGEVVGILTRGQNRSAYRWDRNGVPTILASSGAQEVGINERGEVAGSIERVSGLTAYRWSESAGLVVLPLPTGVEITEVRGINNEGTILAGSSATRFILWDSRNHPQVVEIPSSFEELIPTGLNDLGWVVGYAKPGDSEPIPFAWIPDKGFFDLGDGLAAGRFGTPRAVNNRGMIVGQDGLWELQLQ